MKRKRSALFVKNLALFLIPMLIPLMVLGALSIFITQRHIVDQINRNNSNLLTQIRDNVEIILNELDSLNLNFSTNPEIIVRLKTILTNPNPALQLEDLQSLQSIKNFIDAPANARPYIHSIYVTFENEQSRLLTTSDGLVNINDFYDNSWFEIWGDENKERQVWTELREIKRYAFEKRSTKILTLYRRLGVRGSNGLLMLNINADYIVNLLTYLETFPDQIISIVDENNQVIFSNQAQSPFGDYDIDMLVSLSEYPSEVVIKNTSYIISSLTSKRYKWKYISFVPRYTLYDIPFKLTSLTLFLLFLSFLSGLVLTYIISRKNYRYIENIIAIINSAEKNKPMPDISYSPKDEYGFIIQNIIKTFVEHSYMGIQLSERKFRLKTMQLLALQSQINPHFLYNTLETINWKILSLTKKPSQANQMVENLSDILKYCLDDPLKTVTLDDEIKNTISYVEIQRVRYRDKFDVLWEYNEDETSIKVIKLILQPIIENCIYHGIKEKDGKSLIKIKIFKIQCQLKISVIDNGLGICDENLKIIRQNLEQKDDFNNDFTSHIGLYNINKRLKLNYGEEYGVIIRSRQGVGTVVQLRIPAVRTCIYP